jgi:hypothetical protein
MRDIDGTDKGSKVNMRRLTRRREISTIVAIGHMLLSCGGRSVDEGWVLEMQTRYTIQ